VVVEFIPVFGSSSRDFLVSVVSQLTLLDFAFVERGLLHGEVFSSHIENFFQFNSRSLGGLVFSGELFNSLDNSVVGFDVLFLNNLGSLDGSLEVMTSLLLVFFVFLDFLDELVLNVLGGEVLDINVGHGALF